MQLLKACWKFRSAPAPLRTPWPMPPAAAHTRRYFRLKQEVRFLRREARSLSLALQRGAGFEETLPSYEQMMQTVRRAQNNARSVFTTADMQQSADATRAILNQLGPFYDANFSAADAPERR